MNLIIRLIIQIFEAVFEQDVKRRTPPQPAPGQRQARTPPKPPPQAKQRTMEEWLESLLGVEAPPPPPRRPPVQTQAPPKPGPPSLQEHFRALDAQTRKKMRKSREKKGQPTKQLGVERVRTQERTGFRMKRLPGDTLLEQMVYADVILGPCKAIRNKRPKSRNLG